MPKKKCPACGSTDTVKIIYGMPTHEAFEAAQRGEFVLGGCCISGNDPSRHCKICGQDFGGNDNSALLEMTLFEFYVGGYSGTSYYIFIDGKRKNKTIKYAETPGGMYVDLKHPKNEVNLNPNIIFKEIQLSPEQWLAFITELSRLDISCWKDKYYDNDVCDGTQWNIVIKLPNNNKISKCGSNEYPPYWTRFIKIMKKYVDENIE